MTKIIVRSALPAILFMTGICFAFTGGEILSLQSALKDRPVGERIAATAEKFIGTPYDPDPLGAYVTKAAVVADGEVDCMYLVFRAVEIALTSTPEEAVTMALQMRFHSRGVLHNGKVVNYDNRYRYGEDMIESGKWGGEITATLGKTVRVEGTRGKAFPAVLTSRELLKGIEKLRNGDIVFFIKDPAKKVEGELVGHIGIVRAEAVPHGAVYLIHASGTKGKGGMVKKVRLKDYIGRMPFIGARITRFP
jgi:hypothetical protein